MAELRDRVAERVVEGAEGLLATVEMDDRDALQGRGERGGGRLEPVPDQEQRIRRAPAGAPSRPLRASSRPGWRRAGPRSRRRRRATAGSTSGSKPSARTSSIVCPCRVERCVPPTSSRSSSSGCDRIATAVECRIPQSWRPVVRTAMVFTRPPSSTIAPARARRRCGRAADELVHPRRGDAAYPVAGASRSPSATVSPADRSRAQCRLRRATARDLALGRGRDLVAVADRVGRRPGWPRPSPRTRPARATSRDRARGESGRASGASR